MSTTGLSPSARIAILLRRRIGSLREDRQFDTIVRQKHAHIVGFSMVGLLCSTLTQLVVWSFRSSDTELRDAYYDDDTIADSNGATLINILYLSQAVLSWSTIVVGALIGQKYRLILMAKRAEWTGTSLIEAEAFRGDNVLNTQDRARFLSSYSFWRSPLKWWFLLEMLIQLPHPVLWMNSAKAVPGINTPKNIAFKLLQVHMFFRLGFIPNLIHLMSPAYIKRFEIVNRSRELLSVGFKFRPALTLKIFFFENTVLTLVGMMAINVIIFGFCQWTVSRQEIRYNDAKDDTGFGSIWNCIWFSYVAYATIGFGDYAPPLPFGRVISVMTTLAGTLIFVVFSGVVVNRVSLTKEQRYGVEYLATRRGDEVYRDAALRLLHVFARYSLDKLKEEADNTGEVRRTAAKGHKGNQLYLAIRRFRAARQMLESAFMQPEDIVINEKLAAIDLMSSALRADVEKYTKEVLVFEEHVQQRLRSISDRVNRYVTRGHVAV